MHPNSQGASAGRVLVVEDDAIAGAVCARALKNAGYEVVTAASALDALSQLQEAPFDLVIADVVMPEMDGIDLVRTMRMDEQLTRVPLILLTGCQEEATRLRGFRAGCDSYLLKPVRPAELVDHVDSLLMSAMGTRAQLSSASLSGRLDETSVATILAFLHVQERSGLLRVSRFGASGEITLRNGELHGASVGHDLLGEPALCALLGWNAGTFRFEHGEVSDLTANLSGEFTFLIERARADQLRD